MSTSGRSRSPGLRLRQTTVGDSAALADLVAQSPDSGRVSTSPRYHAPLVEVVQTMHPDGVGVVAELPGSAELVGSARVSFGRCRIEGGTTSYAMMSSLVVHPDHRRQGVAKALTAWRLEKVAERGDDPLVLAAIQKGNVGSSANTASWADQVCGRVLVVPVPMRSRPPRSTASVGGTVRAVRPDELEQLAERLNAFYADYDLSTPQDADSIASWLTRSPVEKRVNHYVVAVDGSGRLVAGVGVQEEALLVSLEVTRMPPIVRLANLAVKVVPRDNRMRNLNATMMWFAPGHLAAGRQLWQSLRWTWRDRGSCLLSKVDARSPLRQMMHNPPWLPTTSLSLALRAGRPLDPERLLDPPG